MRWGVFVMVRMNSSRSVSVSRSQRMEGCAFSVLQWLHRVHHTLIPPLNNNSPRSKPANFSASDSTSSTSFGPFLGVPSLGYPPKSPSSSLSSSSSSSKRLCSSTLVRRSIILLFSASSDFSPESACIKLSR
ncbi:hypothetical protein M427DRAFT_208352 [Gonapodya prolifera JEL478]|uniref:Uncharacterized protein n=1 Tax=Gonapodya prolifera (strain JEL478) TaxID=1344416 RepID=A0A139ANL8_GONPJ|nr:hypothetical protein M427DRAFT_208352 [Gonapodya prolifera JEL478]|eukprot:KXS18339.1 hypothetical protein M427DRAFT_208352 [Gonapodya prolifera JEL478]